MSTDLQVLYEDNHLLVVSKPAGLATLGVANNELSLAKLAKSYLKAKYQKPGNVYLGVTSRLDAAVSGVVVFARTSKAAARLTEQFRSHTVEKIYLATTEGRIEPAFETLEDWVSKNDARHRMEIVGAHNSGAQLARLAYRRLTTIRESSLVEVRLETGRKHQIRLQLSSKGHPVIGDRKYGSTRAFAAGIALHSARLTIEHPTRHEPLTIVCLPPAPWRGLGLENAVQTWLLENPGETGLHKPEL